jgi:multidrug resistance protein
MLIWVTVFVDLIGFGIVIPILPFYAVQHGASPFELGLLLASYSGAQFLFAPLLGTWSDRLGRKPVLAVSLYGTAAASTLLGLASTMPRALWLLFVARVLDGITGANIAAAQAYVADVTPEDKRARGMGLIGMAFGLGFVLGPAIGGLLAEIDIAAPFYAVAMLATLNATAMLFILPEPERHISYAVEARSRYARIGATFRDARTGRLLTVFLFASIAFSAMEATLALVLKDRFGYGPRDAAYLFALLGVMMAVVQGGLVGRLVRRFGEPALVIAGTGLLAVGLALIGAPLPSTLVLLVGVLVLVAAGVGLYNPSLTGLVSRLTPRTIQGTTLGVTQSMASIGRILGPLAGGLLYGLGGGLPFYFGAALMALATVLMALHAPSLPPPGETTA